MSMTPQEIQREREAFDRWNNASDIGTVTASRWSGWLARAKLAYESSEHVRCETSDEKSNEHDTGNKNG